MGRARDLANLINGQGTLPDGAIPSGSVVQVIQSQFLVTSQFRELKLLLILMNLTFRTRLLVLAQPMLQQQHLKMVQVLSSMDKPILIFFMMLIKQH